MSSWLEKARLILHRLHAWREPGLKDVPVVVLIFNRPDHAARLMKCVRAVQPRRLFVVADGPREGREGEREQCLKARQAVLDAVDWPAEVETNFSDQNLGCRRRVSTGLDWVFGRVSQAIILEDDLEPHPSFFAYCAQLLKRYKNDTRVGAISGDCFQKPQFDCGASYYFSIYPHCWGWATWRRAWQCYDHELSSWPEYRKRKGLLAWLNHKGETDYWRWTIDQVVTGKLDSWATVWIYSLWKSQMLVALPARNLVSNHGFDDQATHTMEARSPLSGLPVFEMQFPMVHPATVSRNEEADAFTRQHVFGVS
jgi:hypothetical protein